MKFNYLVLSDIHLGHNVNKTENIIENLKKFFVEYAKFLKNLNAIFLAGDVFDKLLISSSNEFLLINRWLTELLLYCKKYNIMLRVLEGTHSHDWNQAKVITSIIERLELDLDYKYIDDIVIEKNTKYDITILYVPDDYNPDAKITYNVVKEKLKENLINEVDIAIMHGQFHYQLPGITLLSSHTEENYINIVKYFINIGHIHTFSINGKIIAQGSFDRLAHNEEEPKGGILVNIDTEKENSFKFLTNKHAMIFKTININNLTIDELIKLLDTEVKKIPNNSSVRLLGNIDQLNLEQLRKRYSNINIKLDKKQEKENKTKLIEDKIIIDGFSITKDNIKQLLLKELEKHDLTTKELKIVDEELDDSIMKFV